MRRLAFSLTKGDLPDPVYMYTVSVSAVDAVFSTVRRALTLTCTRECHKKASSSWVGLNSKSAKVEASQNSALASTCWQ